MNYYMIYIIIPRSKHEKLIINVMCKCYCSYNFELQVFFTISLIYVRNVQLFIDKLGDNESTFHLLLYI